MMDKPIGAYPSLPAAFHEYDPAYPKAAGALMDAIRSALPDITAHHIGSTSVPGCGGKGYLDLAIPFGSSEESEVIKRGLEEMGFQKQTTRDPFPEDRPMRTGAFRFEGKTYPVHVHVIPASSPELSGLLAFRERLRGDAEYLASYIRLKKKILSEGVTDPVEYSERKGEFFAPALSTPLD